MKKFGKFLKDVFTKNIFIKILALVLAAVAVAMINIGPSEKKDSEKGATACSIYEIGETYESD